MPDSRPNPSSRILAEERRKHSARIKCEIWNAQMIGLGGPAQPSPTIGDALAGGYPYLEIRCERCRTHALIHLDVVDDLRRKPHTPIWKLEASLRCRHCTWPPHRRITLWPRFRPPARLVRLRQTESLAFEAWFPNSGA